MELSTMYKAEKGLIKITAEVENNIINEITITGDFFMLPEEALLVLERSLRGQLLVLPAITDVINNFYSIGVVTPSMEKDDLVKVIMGLSEKSSTK